LPTFDLGRQTQFLPSSWGFLRLKRLFHQRYVAHQLRLATVDELGESTKRYSEEAWAEPQEWQTTIWNSKLQATKEEEMRRQGHRLLGLASMPLQLQQSLAAFAVVKAQFAQDLHSVQQRIAAAAPVRQLLRP